MAQCLLCLLEQPKTPNPGTVKTRTKGEEIMMLRRLVLFAVATSLALVLVRTAGAQNASVNGTVTDSTGALVQNATVTATNTATKSARSVQTGAAGVYSINEVVAGLYDLTIEKTGFRTVRFAAVTLTVDQAVTLNAKLEIGSNAEQVTVEGTAVPVDTTDAQLSNVVEHEQMTELPLILRDPYQLVLLSPGVTQSDGLGGISANGGRERNNNFMLDGADNNDTEVPGGLGGITSQNPDSTEEFRVITNNFAPEYGRNNGAIIDVVTRSGTNNWHGDAFYFGRWDALGARDFFNHQIDPTTGLVAGKNPYVRNLYGASLGGPLIKDKTFFFVNYQGDRFVTNTTNTSTVPTEAFKTGVFTYTNPNTGASQALDVSTSTGANNGTGLSLDPVVQKILALYPKPSSANSDGITGNLFFPSESREKDEDAVLKIDQKIGKNNTFTARYIYNWFHDPNPFHDDFLPIDGGLGAVFSFQRTQGLALSLTSNPSPTLVNELRASTNRTNLFFGCNGTGIFDSFGFTDQVGRGADFNLPSYSGFGCLSLGDADDQGRKTGTYQYWDTLSKVAGTHTMKFGAEFRNVYSNNFTDFSSRATFTFDVFTANGVPVLANLNPNMLPDENAIQDTTSLLLGVVNSQSQTQYFTKGGARESNDELDFRQRELGIFAQDEWKVRTNLTLTYGLRWEYYGVPFEAHGNLSNLFEDPSGAAPALTGGGTGFTYSPVGPGTGHQLYQSYYNNFEPRVGFAWDPFKKGKTSIRGGIGAFSDRVYGNLVSDARGNPPFQPSVANQIIQSATSYSAAQLVMQSAPLQLTPSPVVGNLGPPPTFLGGLTFPDLFATNMKPPSSVAWNFGIQHQLGSRLTVEANYVGNHGTRILRVSDGNAPQPALVAGLVNYCSNPANIYGCNNSTLQYNLLYYGGDVGALPNNAVNNNAFLHTFTDQTSGQSWYDGLQAKITERDFHGLQIQLSYTWSHALDNSSDPLATTLGNGNYPVDSFALNREYGNSGFDTRQRAVMNFIYQPNIGRGKSFLSNGFAGRVFEGWQLSGIASFQTGLPYDIFGPLDTLHTGIADRATVIDSSVLKTVPTTGKMNSAGGVFTGFNPAAFNLEDGVSAPIPWGVPANIDRNNWYGPGVNNWDMSLSKMTALTERVKLQLRFEVYNVFNRVQFAKPNNNTSSSNFGYSLSQVGQNDGTTGARQIQLGGKLTF
jgi:Carboxypeptidase regulatory-like domain